MGHTTDKALKDKPFTRQEEDFLTQTILNHLLEGKKEQEVYKHVARKLDRNEQVCKSHWESLLCTERKEALKKALECSSFSPRVQRWNWSLMMDRLLEEIILGQMKQGKTVDEACAVASKCISRPLAACYARWTDVAQHLDKDETWKSEECEKGE